METYSTMGKMLRILLNIFDDAIEGEKGIRLGQPQSLLDLTNINSALRLMAPEGSEQPLITFSKHKQNINLWLNSLVKHNLTESEIDLLKSYLSKSYGLCIDQETIMRMSMDTKISGFSVKDANGLRKAIAKKKIELLKQSKELFFEKGKSMGTSDNLLSYVWEECFMLSAGYGLNESPLY